jgi:hypothetical protein
MRTEHLPIFTLIAGILSVTVGGCSGSEPGSSGGGGTTGVVEATGGVVANGTGGSVNTGGAGQTATGGAAATGGSPPTGGVPATGGTTAGTGGNGAGGSSTKGSGGANQTGGAIGIGGAITGGRSGVIGGAATGGSRETGGSATGTATGGRLGTGGASGVVATGGRIGTGGASGARTGGSTSTGPCSATASKAANVTVSGSGTHQVVVESNSDISCGTIYRPSDLGGTEKYPIFVWGEGACTRSGTSNTAAMGEIASHGYFVIADGPPNGGGNCASIGMSTDVVGMAKPLLEYITWAIAENGKSCSAYYQSLDTTKVAADGFSCGGLMAAGTASDSRMTAWGITSSGLTAADQNFYKSIHTPVKILLGGSGDIAYTNGERDYTNISALAIPIILFSKSGAGHGGDLGASRGGDFTKVNLAWLNWQLKGDTTATGKGFLVGSGCTFCSNSAWEVKSANLP